ncbi:MAG TPA: class I SAM-dependent methyltransferase [Armatimonadota bacterium]|nr:class I SAM-dependent methyltransferase [Armatimonadota bacterium]
MNALAVAERTMSLPRLPLEPDLFGRVLDDCHRGISTEYFLRRDDNLLERDSSLRYFRAWHEMPAHHRCLLTHARGRVLDVGAGAGQHTLVLQERGLAVTAIDASPLAVEVCRRRGVRDAREMDAHVLRFPAGSFDTVLFMQQTLGLAGTPEGLRYLLRRLHRLVADGGQLLADIATPADALQPGHRRYQHQNRALGRYPGTVRQRIEYQGMRGLDFDWLLLPLDDLRALCADTGWKITRCVQVDANATYAIALGKV